MHALSDKKNARGHVGGTRIDIFLWPLVVLAAVVVNAVDTSSPVTAVAGAAACSRMIALVQLLVVVVQIVVTRSCF